MIVDRLTIAYQTSRALAGILRSLGTALPLSASAALALKRSVYAVDAVLAPAITTQADVAAIGRALSLAAAAVAADAAPSDAAPAFATAATAAAMAAPAFSSPALTRAASLGRALSACTEATCLGLSFVAESKRDFADRQSAVAARARVQAAVEGAVDRVAQNAGQDVVSLLNRVSLLVTDHIAIVAADLRPVVAVGTPRSAPSTAIAWELYGDPSRAPELVARNRVATPIFMPIQIQALAPQP